MKNSILKFETKKNKYIFDNVSGNIIPYNDVEEYIIDNYCNMDKEEMLTQMEGKFKKTKDELKGEYDYIKNLISLGYFYRKEEVKAIDLKEDLYHVPMEQLILILTEDCNFRCKYCVYSEQYPQVKGYSKKVMNFQVAKKAIDDYFVRYNKKCEYGYRKKPMISFYGGEPLLNFELIKRVVNYCNQCNYDVRYFITTNGSIMTEEIMECISENDFNVTFSVDGNREQHDRNRVFAGGEKTFDIVYKNIAKLQAYKRKKAIEQSISISCTNDMYSDYKKIVKFFVDNHDVFYPFYIIFNKVSHIDTNYYSFCDKLHEEGIIKENKGISKTSHDLLLQELINNKLSDKELDVYRCYFTSLYLMNNRNRGSIGVWAGACLPSNKVAVAPDGNYYLCERVNQKFAIGNIDTGVNFDRCLDVLNQYLDIINRECKDCNINRLCDKCYMHFIKDENTLKFDKGNCNTKKKGLPKTLSTLYEVLEENPDVLNKGMFDD